MSSLVRRWLRRPTAEKPGQAVKTETSLPSVAEPAVWPVDLSRDPLLKQSFDLLRRKWGEVPFREHDRIRTEDLLKLPERELVATCEECYALGVTGEAFSARGWYVLLYKDIFRGRKVLDVGCGLAPTTIYFAEHGAEVTFLDIVESNVRVVQRICEAKGLQSSFCHMDDLSSLKSLPPDYDFIYCCGSMINMPLEGARMEAQALLEHLPVGGRWVELGYPKARWEREGALPFDRWGERTDGGAPWIEWHDLEKLAYMLSPAGFDAILSLDFHDADFNWFDLIRRT